MNKDYIRSELLRQRKSLRPDQIISLSKDIVNNITASNIYQQAKHIAIYLPFNGEVDLSALLKIKNKQHYLPSIKDQQMQFQMHIPDMHLEQHRYGIEQPTYIESLETAALDLCLMPLVGFDMSGNRLGMGGGFYDRYFEYLNNNDCSEPTTQLAGIGYEFQKQQQLPTQSWDVRINHLFTERGYFKI